MNGDRVAMILDIGNDNKEDELEQLLAIEVGTFYQRNWFNSYFKGIIKKYCYIHLVRF